MNEECEYCAEPTDAKRVVESPMEDEATALARFFWVIDPARLVFCEEECRVRWHALRRRALWDRHPPECMCLGCVGRA